MSAKNTTFAADFDKKLADNELYIRFTDTKKTAPKSSLFLYLVKRVLRVNSSH